jgi:hypothetical protein
MKYIYLFILLCITSSQAVSAQNNTSPYSIIGIGDIESSTFDRSTGMGNTGTSLSSDRFLYSQNPASVAGLGDHFFNVEISARYKGVSYYGTPASTGNSTSSDFQVRKFTLAIKVKPFWGVSAGVMPFSTSSYSFYANTSIQGTIVLNNTYYKGSGGLNEYYINNAFKLGKHFSVGAQVSYLAGSFLQTEQLDSLSLGSSLNTTRNIFLAKFYGKAGIQYQTRLTKKWQLGLGATASNKANLMGNYFLTVTSNGLTLVNNENYKSTNFVIPVIYSGGISLVRNNNLTFAADYQFQNWGSLGYTGLGYTLVNSRRYSAGVQYSNVAGYGANIFEHSNLQAGFYYGNSYLDINGYQLHDFGLTLGAGFSSKTGQFAYQVNMALGQTGTTQNGLVKENYVQIGVTLSYRDVWYTKLKKYF